MSQYHSKHTLLFFEGLGMRVDFNKRAVREARLLKNLFFSFESKISLSQKLEHKSYVCFVLSQQQQ